MLFFESQPGAIVSPDGSICNGSDLLTKIKERATILRNLDIGPRDRIVICHGGTHEFFADLFATWQVGACAVCVNQESSEFELENIVKFCRPSLVLVDDRVGQPKLSVPTKSLIGNKAKSQDEEGVISNNGSLDDPALILFTSGTTGNPKGVVHSFRSILARVAINREFLGRSVLQRSLCMLPTHFGHGLIGNCLTPLYCGGDLILHPLNSMNAFMELGEKIDAFEVTFLSSVPSIWKIALKGSQRPQNATLQQVNVGSAPLSVGLWKRIVDWTGTGNVVNMYGITESANWISGASAADVEPEEGLVGRVWAGSAVVRLQSGELRSTGEGEILINTPSLMQGYYRRPSETYEARVGEYFATGDVGSIDASGMIRIKGRRKLEINRAGQKINPEEIEALVEKNDRVAEACVFGIPDEIAGELVGIAVVLTDLSPDSSPGELNQGVDQVKSWLRDIVIAEKVPEKWYIRSSIPKTDRGKLDRRRVATDCLGKITPTGPAN